LLSGVPLRQEIFPARSTYHAEWESRYGHRLNGGGSNGSINQHPMWNFFWSLKVPTKVKIYLWRLMQEMIPCGAVLANRHVKVSGQCPIWETSVEDTKHMFVPVQSCETSLE
jgi:hypothetical protein